MIEAYKGFNKDLTCRGFQYEVGKEYEEDSASLCNKGFHACLNPLDCFGYYAPGSSRFHKVEIEDNGQRQNDDTKICGKKIKIGAELSVAEICKLHFEFVKSQCNPVESNAAGDKESASAGYRGSASAGNYGSASAGYRGSASAGNYGSASAGNYGSASAGNYGIASSRGNSSTDAQGISVVRGNNVKAKGGLGTLLVIAIENNNDYEIRHYKAVVVDGKKVKADTWYTLNENGCLVEVKE